MVTTLSEILSNKFFLHMKTVNDESDDVLITANFLDAAFEWKVTQQTPKRFGDVFQTILIDTGVGRRITAGHLQ